MKKEIVILGGGFAGLAAGVELASRGHQVTLFERRGHLGGRAYSFRDPMTGSILDNGQHIFIGCYRATLSFLEKIGRRNDLGLQKNLTVHFAAPGQGMTRFRAWPLPSPWHLIGGLVPFSGFSLAEKWNFSKMRKASLAQDLDGKTIPEWLAEHGQGERVRARFWDLLALAALNDDPAICSAAVFEPVVREALFAGRKDSCIGLSRVGLSELYAEPAAEFIEKHGGHILLKTPAVKLHFVGRELREIELEGGRRIAAEVLILALPFTALKKILPEWMVYQDPFFAPLHLLQTSPIVAINLWFDQDFVPADFVGFWGTRVHWLFNKRRILKQADGYLSLVISGARQELKTPGPELVQMALGELEQIFPESKRAKLLHTHLLKEPEATLSPVRGVGRLRLPQKTPFRNLYLAGDWTDTGLPATIEGAVRSALKVVEMIDSER